MIKLTRAPKPTYLSEAKVCELVANYKTTDKSVWRHKSIIEPLLHSSHSKCAYCECSIVEESKYMEVDHFAHKDTYPDKVVDWENLIPSCKRCNVAKGTHDTVADPIVNPFIHTPRDHLAFRLYRLIGTSRIGDATVPALDLNHSDRLVKKRFEIGQSALVHIETSVERLEIYKSNPSTRTRNRLISMVETILNECQPQAIYSAITATIVFTTDDFIELITELKTQNLWTSHLEELRAVAIESVLDYN